MTEETIQITACPCCGAAAQAIEVDDPHGGPGVRYRRVPSAAAEATGDRESVARELDSLREFIIDLTVGLVNPGAINRAFRDHEEGIIQDLRSGGEERGAVAALRKVLAEAPLTALSDEHKVTWQRWYDDVKAVMEATEPYTVPVEDPSTETDAPDPHEWDEGPDMKCNRCENVYYSHMVEEGEECGVPSCDGLIYFHPDPLAETDAPGEGEPDMDKIERAREGIRDGEGVPLEEAIERIRRPDPDYEPRGSEIPWDEPLDGGRRAMESGRATIAGPDEGSGEGEDGLTDDEWRAIRDEFEVVLNWDGEEVPERFFDALAAGVGLHEDILRDSSRLRSRPEPTVEGEPTFAELEADSLRAMMYEFADAMWPGDREWEGNPDMQHIRDNVLARLRERPEGERAWTINTLAEEIEGAIWAAIPDDLHAAIPDGDVEWEARWHASHILRQPLRSRPKPTVEGETARTGREDPWPEIIEAIYKERRRQDEKWGTSFPDRDWDRWLTILTEEVGEFAEAVLEMPYRDDGEEAIRKELIQVAAVAVSALTFGAPQGSQRGAGGDGIHQTTEEEG